MKKKSVFQLFLLELWVSFRLPIVLIIFFSAFFTLAYHAIVMCGVIWVYFNPNSSIAGDNYNKLATGAIAFAAYVVCTAAIYYPSYWVYKIVKWFISKYKTAKAMKEFKSTAILKDDKTGNTVEHKEYVYAEHAGEAEEKIINKYISKHTIIKVTITES